MAFAVPIFSEGFGFFVCFLQSWPHQDLLSRYVLGLAMFMFPPLRRYHHNLRLTDDLTVLARIEIVAILVHYQPSCNTSHTIKPSDPILLANVSLHCGMYPAGKVNISRHQAILRFPQSDHNVGNPSSGAGSLCITKALRYQNSRINMIYRLLSLAFRYFSYHHSALMGRCWKSARWFLLKCIQYLSRYLYLDGKLIAWSFGEAVTV